MKHPHMSFPTPLRWLLPALIALCLTTALHAQNVDAAVKSLESGDYKSAMAELDKALTEPIKLKDKALAKAYYYRAIARVAYLEKAKGNLAGMQMQQVRDLATGAGTDLAGAKKNDTDGKLAADLLTANKRYIDLMLALGAESHATAQNPSTKPDVKKVADEDCILFSDPVIAIDKFQYLAYVHKGSGLIGLGDSLEGLKNYKLADDWFFRSSPKNGDMMIAYTYIQIARLEWALNHDYETAMKAIEEGRAALGGEGKKIQSLGNRPPAEKAALDKKQHDIEIDLDRAASDIRLAAGK